jgi:hypothetical protein
MDDPDVKGLVEYLRVVLDTTDSLEQEKEGAIRNFRACWDRAGVSLADLEMRSDEFVHWLFLINIPVNFDNATINPSCLLLRQCIWQE